MARVFGGVSTDRVTSGLTAHNSLRSYSVWIYRTGNGGGSLGRVFDKRQSGGTEVELLNTSVGGMHFIRTFSTTPGDWTVTPPSANVWHHILLTYDSSATANNPVVYIDGTSVTVTRATGPVGTASTNADAYVIGNRESDNARNWAGGLAEFAAWDFILGLTDAQSLSAGGHPTLLPYSSVLYLPLWGVATPEPDLSGNIRNGTVTGTALMDGPPVGPFIRQRGLVMQAVAAAAAAKANPNVLGPPVAVRRASSY